MINGYTFYTKFLDDRSTVQNSSVLLEAKSMHFSSLKDKKPKLAVMPYYGVIEEIWVVDYIKIKFTTFKCKWINVNNSVQIDQLGFTLVNINSRSLRDELFCQIMKQISQNSNPDSCERGWELLAFCCCTFVPSNQLLKYPSLLIKNATWGEKMMSNKSIG